eukprot:GILJ01031561.1.p1 GENE.GILJ01031561.1~~GILJ01031561.1.p1  ORF type:complete len:155 (-),score=12.82 GILJ01031561.1:4-468(-)
MKWLLRLTGKEVKLRTPIPPKPYRENVFNPVKHATDPRYYDPKDISILDHDKPHWQDPRFESRASTPVFDFFGFNRDWGNTLFKLGFLVFACGVYMEMQMVLNLQDSDVADTHSFPVAQPGYAQSNSVSNDELKAAGFEVVGAKELSSLTIGRR